ncbi:4413_t:CDS:2 [Entrophospora sp. SA101]|nr:4413_t:CDS:2 [Entrophospora sp. SA101]CAJ0840662.1 11338_t:CDS:2 [Entrophospora sp. SA101]CAJ0840681.1 11345_t:CDS:2 [Entrophospora sp. SA101]CAJ0847176.1 10161_t:CDS:2 [Entrophospora sp. SA101]
MWPGTFGQLAIMASTESNKSFGPFTNDQDYEWKFTGSEDSCDVHEIS